MAAGNYMGMFGVAGEESLREAELARQRQQAVQLSGMDPRQQVAYANIRGGQMLGAGVREAVGALGGSPTVAQLTGRVRQQLEIALRDIDPSDIEKYYPVVIRVLRANNMFAEAQQAAREFEDLRLKRQTQNRLDREQTRKEKSDEEKAAAVKERLAIARSGTPQAKAEAVAKLVAEMDAEPNPQEVLKLEAQLQMFGYKPDRTRDWQVTLVQGNKNEPARILKYNRATGKYEVQTLDGSKATGGGAEGPKAPKDPQPLKDAYGVAQVNAQGEQIYKGKDGSLWTLGPDGWLPSGEGSGMGRDQSDRALKGSDATKVALNNALLSQIARALGLVLKGKEHLGPQAYLNKLASLYDRLDTAGIPVRASIADLGSALVQARSGAAVTDKEFERLQPFIPQQNDSGDMAEAKLRNMRSTATSIIGAVRGRAGITGETGSGKGPRATTAADVAVSRGADGKLVIQR
jgi:hypothetical protein